jgi:hypothetical protein
MHHDLEVGGIHIVNPFAGDVPVPEAS